MLEDPKTMSAIKADQIKPSILGPFGCIHKPAAQIPNVAFVQRPRLNRIIGKGPDWLCRNRHWHFFGIEVWTIHAGIGQLNTCQGAVLFHSVRHFAQHGNVFIFPKAQFDKGCDLRGVMHLALFGKNNPPAAFGFGRAHFRSSRGVTIAPPITMGHLIKAVLGRYRANIHGVE